MNEVMNQIERKLESAQGKFISKHDLKVKV